MSDQFIPVPFRTETLFILEHGAKPYIPMKPIVEGMGLDWKSQHRKLISEQRYGHIIIPWHSPGGLQETLCLPLRKLTGWLFSINPAKVKPELRDTIVAYQDECFEALYAYWHHGIAERDPEKSDENAADLPPAPGFTPPQSPFARLDAGIMRELRLINPLLAQGYLVSCGITPQYVERLVAQLPALPGSIEGAMPLAKVAFAVQAHATAEDLEAWYLDRTAWLTACGDYDPRATAVWLRELGYLRTNEGRLTYRTGIKMINGRRALMFCVLKTIARVDQDERSNRHAH